MQRKLELHRSMLSRRSILTAVILMAACGSSGSAPNTAATEASDLRRRLDAYLRQQAVEGYSGVVLVARNGEVLLREAYSRDRSVTPETAFWIGSVSKTLTAAGILRLRDQGRLSLEDPITRFFPSVPPDKRGITVRHLLTHTAGLGENYAADGIADRAEAVRAILARPLVRRPGSGYGYSNDAYNLLAAIIEIASRQPFESYLREQVLRPARMQRTGFRAERNRLAPLAPSARPAGSTPSWGLRGATGIYSTVDDLYRWHLALSNSTVLPDSTRRQAFAPQVFKEPGETKEAYGYGWQVVRTARGTTLLAHGGAESQLQHSAALYRYVDEDVVVITLSNAPEWRAQETLKGIVRLNFPD